MKLMCFPSSFIHDHSSFVPEHHIHGSLYISPGGRIRGKDGSEKFSHAEGVLSIGKTIVFYNERNLS